MMNMLELALKTKAKILHTSTSEIYGDPLVIRKSRATGGTSTPSESVAATMRASVAPRRWPPTIAANTVSMSVWCVSLIRMDRTCIRTMDVSSPISSCKP